MCQRDITSEKDDAGWRKSSNGIDDDAAMIVARGPNVPAAPNRCAKLSLQILNLIPVQLPKVWMVVQSMPRFHRRDLSFEVDARR